MLSRSYRRFIATSFLVQQISHIFVTRFGKIAMPRTHLAFPFHRLHHYVLTISLLNKRCPVVTYPTIFTTIEEFGIYQVIETIHTRNQRKIQRQRGCEEPRDGKTVRGCQPKPSQWMFAVIGTIADLFGSLPWRPTPCVRWEARRTVLMDP